ncbi:chloride channel CLIC-like protein 1 [Hydractinia symbiolongicarpus]|uniref:chloride channel CLIC-like protein 1 n=1 Tax=Hydractinia symbiolongicarpus TaxID=13093 RepID=UPI00255136AF|nr:chloride channel CLIC-like protein 1 [Hydractinia symbiolongicarpus]
MYTIKNINILHDVVFLLSLTVVVSSDTVDENGGVYNTYDESGWVDPYDLTTSRPAKKQERVTSDSDELVKKLADFQDEASTCRESLQQVKNELLNCKFEERSPVVNDLTYFKHLVNTFVKLAEVQGDQGDVYAAYFSLSEENRNLALSLLGKTDLSEAKKILDILQDAFQPSSTSPWKQASEIITPRVIIGAVGINLLMFLLLFVTRQVQLTQSWKRTVMITFLLCFMCSIPWEWHRMYKVELAKKTSEAMKDVPEDCFPNNLTPWKSVTLWFKDTFTTSDDACAKYHQNILVDPVWEVSPLQATAVCASRFIFEPMKQFSSALGVSFRLLMKEVPVQWQPVLFVVIVLIVVFVVMAMTGFEISSPLLRVGFRQNVRGNEGERILQLEGQVRKLNEERLALQQNMLEQNQLRIGQIEYDRGVQNVRQRPYNNEASPPRDRVGGGTRKRKSVKNTPISSTNESVDESSEMIECLESLNLNETAEGVAAPITVNDVAAPINEDVDFPGCSNVSSILRSMERSNVSSISPSMQGSNVSSISPSMERLSSVPCEHDENPDQNSGSDREYADGASSAPRQESTDIMGTKLVSEDIGISDSDYEFVSKES